MTTARTSGSSVSQGFFWWEIDAPAYMLRGLEWLGVARSLHRPPDHIVAGRRRRGLPITSSLARPSTRSSRPSVHQFDQVARQSDCTSTTSGQERPLVGTLEARGLH